MNNKNLVLFHIIGCITFLMLPLLFFPSNSKSFNVFTSPPSQRDFLGQVLLIAFFYCNYFVLIPKLYFNKKYLLFYAITVCCFLIIIFLPYLLLHPFHKPPGMPPGGFNGGSNMPPPQGFSGRGNAPPYSQPLRRGPFFGEVSHHIFLFFVCFFFSISLRTSTRLKQIQQEKLDTELSYLKAQINPHFLFNTLNSIYSLAIQKTDTAPDAIIKLSEMMRYVLHDSSHNFVPLEKEITYITNYIQLQKIRFTHSMQLNFNVSGNTSGKQIAPLILIPFIENAFKYGVNAADNSEIKIAIEVAEDALTMEVYNKKVNTTFLPGEQGGVGISNAKKRLMLLYAGYHELVINNNPADFFISLKLSL